MLVPVQSLFTFTNWFGDFLVVYQSLVAHKSVSDTSLLLSTLSKVLVLWSVAQASQRVLIAWVSSHLVKFVIHYLFDLAYAELFFSYSLSLAVLIADFISICHIIFCRSFG